VPFGLPVNSSFSLPAAWRDRRSVIDILSDKEARNDAAVQQRTGDPQISFPAPKAS
jgi:hypothetical protein